MEINLQCNVISKFMGCCCCCCSDSDGGGGGRDINSFDDILGLHIRILKLGFLNRVRQCIVMYNAKQ